MVTIILMITLLILVAGLVVEIGIASWNIRRAGRYQRQLASKTEHETSLSSKFQVLDRYATDISWLLKFLYNRYGQFIDLEKEIQMGIQDSRGDTPIMELKQRFDDLKRADKIIKTTVRAAEKIEKFMGSIASQISSIAHDFENESEDDDEVASEKETAENEKPDVGGNA